MALIRYGILGAGRIAEKFAKTIQAGLTREVRLLGAASGEAARSREFAEKYGLPRGYAGYGELLADPDIDIVYIANLNDMHAESIGMCIDAGKPVLCEKPMFLRADEAEGLIRRAEKAGVFLMEAMWTRFTPAFRKALEWAESGRIGRLRCVSASYCGARDPAEYARLYDPARYGGAMYDLGVYGIQLAQIFARGHVPQDARAVFVPSGTGVDEAAFIHMVYDGGLVAEIKCAIGWDARNDAMIYGDKGYIRIAPCFNAAQKVEIYAPPFPADDSLEPAVPLEVFTKESPSGMEYEIDHAARCVRDGLRESQVMPPAESLEIARLFETLSA